MRKIIIALAVLCTALTVGPAMAQAHTVEYNLQRDIAAYEQVQVRAVYMFGASQGQWTAEMCSNHYVYSGGVQHVANVTEWVLQGRYSGDASASWYITSALHYPYLCDPSVFGQIIPF